MLRKLLLLAAIMVGAAGVAVFSWIYSVTVDLPSTQELKKYEPPITSRVHAGDGLLVAELARQHRVFVPYEEMPDQLIQAFVSAEDKSFFEHDGLDFKGILRAAMRNIKKKATGGGSLEGASTITQQVAKNMLLTSEQKFSRKVKEAFIARAIERELGKERILELYLNEIYLGGRSYGVGAAALNYFGKSLRDLSLSECALLAALPKAPGKVNPYRRPDAATARRNWVLSRMVANGYITEEVAAEAEKDLLETEDRLNSDAVKASAYFVEEVRREILRRTRDGELSDLAPVEDKRKASDEEQDLQAQAEQLLYEGGLSVRSTLDSGFQLAAQNALQNGLETYDRRHGFRGPIAAIETGEGWPERLAEVSIPNGAERWEPATVLTASSSAIKIGLLSGDHKRLASESVTWASTFQREGKGKGKGLKPGDVVLVTQAPPPDVLTRTAMDEVKVGTNEPYHLRQLPQVEGALVAVDPHTGRVLAMAGGYSFNRSQFNRAIQASRQPGSSFKPFVYAAALDSGFTPASTVLDAPFVIETPQGLWKPGNYSAGRFYGESTLRLGIEKSRNLMTARLAQDVGMDRIAEYGRRFGIYPTPPEDATDAEKRRIIGPQTYLSRSLGSGDTTPLKMAMGYAMLVNGGKYVEPVLMDRIQDRYGKTILRRDDRACEGCNERWSGQAPPVLEDTREQIIDPITAYQSVSLMQGVVERGTATRVRAIGKPVAGKTGTTNDYIDAWFVGFSPDLVAAVWVGYDTPKTLGDSESGGRVAAPIFRDFMMVALNDAPHMPFRLPSGVRLVEIDAKTGKLPGPGTYVTVLEAFKPGTEPGSSGEDLESFFEQMKARSEGYEYVPGAGAEQGAPADAYQPYGMNDSSGFPLEEDDEQPPVFDLEAPGSVSPATSGGSVQGQAETGRQGPGTPVPAGPAPEVTMPEAAMPDPNSDSTDNQGVAPDISRIFGAQEESGGEAETMPEPQEYQPPPEQVLEYGLH